MASKPTVVPPYFPIIYVRGFAMRPSDIAETVATPYMGFNDGATKKRQRPDGKAVKYFFESPVVRLMKDYDYRDVYQDGVQLTQSIPSRSIIIYRYYDQDDEDFGEDHASRFQKVYRAVVGDLGDVEKMKGWAEKLGDLIRQVKGAVCGSDEDEQSRFRVHLVAHSMGGLICRCLLQNEDIDADAARMVAKVFTYATPHGGIEFMGRNWAPAYFRQEAMRKYLKLSEDQYVNSLDGKFPERRFFCLVGTDSSDYEVAHGMAKRGAGVMSDGLVAIKNATVKNSPCAYVHRSHSGPFGIVNSEDGYQNLVRFLFADLKIEGRLFIDRLPQSPVDPDPDADPYYIEVTTAPKAAAGYRLTRRRRDDWSAILRRKSELVSEKPRYPTLFSLFFGRLGTAERPIFSLDLAISEGIAEEKGVARVKDFQPDQYLYRQAILFRVGSARGGLHYSLSALSYGVPKWKRAARPSLEEERYQVKIAGVSGLDARLEITIRRDERDYSGGGQKAREGGNPRQWDWLNNRSQGLTSTSSEQG